MAGTQSRHHVALHLPARQSQGSELSESQCERSVKCPQRMYSEEGQLFSRVHLLGTQMRQEFPQGSL